MTDMILALLWVKKKRNLNALGVFGCFSDAYALGVGVAFRDLELVAENLK